MARGEQPNLCGSASASPLVYHLTCPYLVGLTLQGALKTTLHVGRPVAQAQQMVIQTRGASALTVEGSLCLERLKILAQGTSKVSLIGGRLAQLDVKSQGASRLELLDLTCQEAEVATQGASSDPTVRLGGLVYRGRGASQAILSEQVSQTEASLGGCARLSGQSLGGDEVLLARSGVSRAAFKHASNLVINRESKGGR